MNGLCCYEPVEPMRRGVRVRSVWRDAATVALQLAVLVGCLVGACVIGGAR